MLAEILERDGHRSSSPASGREALRGSQAAPFDLILSDLRMPELDGPGSTASCAASPGAGPAHGVPDRRHAEPAIQRFLEEAKRPYIEKPLDPKQLRQAVAAALAGFNKAL